MNLKFVLVEPKVPQNVGASARAIKTMGFNSLSLVLPCDHMDEKAILLAHGSTEILTSAKVYSSLNDALKNCDLVIGTTARYRVMKHEYIESDHLAELLQTKKLSGSTVAIVFGREESGLTNNELSLCDLTSSISMASGYPSLNLSHAVMIYAYELSSLFSEAHKAIPGKGSEISVRILKDQINEIIMNTGMKLNDPLIGRIFERLSQSGQKDLNLIHSLVSSLYEALKGEKK